MGVSSFFRWWVEQCFLHIFLVYIQSSPPLLFLIIFFYFFFQSLIEWSFSVLLENERGGGWFFYFEIGSSFDKIQCLCCFQDVLEYGVFPQ